jgi:hypothetical protein
MALATVNSPELTQEQVQRILIEPLEQAAVVLAADPRIFDVTAAGVVRIPKLVSRGARAWQSENDLITKVEPDFGEVTLLDRTMPLKSIPVLQRAGPILGRGAPRRAARPDGARRRGEARRSVQGWQRRAAPLASAGHPEVHRRA